MTAFFGKRVWMRRAMRIGLAAIILIAGLAPIGVPILSDNSWRGAPAGVQQPSAAPAWQYRTNNHDEITGVERSDDGGATWHAVASLPAGAGPLQTVSGDEQTLYVLVNGAVWVSHDGAGSWAQTSPLPSRSMSLAAGSKGQALVLAGTESLGLFASRDAGATWQPVVSDVFGNGTAPVALTALAIDQAHGGLVFAASGIWLGTSEARLTPNGVFVSPDLGRSWFVMEAGDLRSAPVTRLSPVDSGVPAVDVTAGTVVHRVELTAMPDLGRALASENAATRAAAATLMGLTHNASTLPLLLAAAADPDPLAGERITAAIGELGDSSAVPQLREMLASPSATVRARAATALGTLAASESVDELLGILRSADPSVTGPAADALAAIGTPEALQGLVVSLGSAAAPSTRHAAMAALEDAGYRSVPALAAGLEAGDAGLRAGAAQVLGFIADESTASSLAAALQDSDPTVSVEAAWALGEIGNAKARAALTAVAGSGRASDPLTVGAAAAALARMDARTVGATVEVSRGATLMAALGDVPASRWTLLGLSLLLAVVVLSLHPRRAQTVRG